MKVNYNLIYKKSSFRISKEEIQKLNFLLTNSQGDFLNLGASSNSTKFNGLNFTSRNSTDVFKLIDEIIPRGLEVSEVNYEGDRFFRKFKGILSEDMSVNVSENNNSDGTFGEKGELSYDDNGALVEKVNVENEKIAQDSFYLCEGGGLIYEIKDFTGELLIDVDLKKRDDFDEFGRNYKVYNESGVIIVEYQKEGTDLVLFLGIKALNFSYDLIDEWIKKEYSYSKERNSLWERYVYRPVKVNVSNTKKIYFGYGNSKKDVFTQIELISKGESMLKNSSSENYEELVSEGEFQRPITEDVSMSYSLSKWAMNNFLNKNLHSFENGTFAGYPWFSDVWARDDIITLRSFINMGDYDIVKKKIDGYLDKINPETGGVEILLTKESNDSCDSILFLGKRCYDFIDALIRDDVFNEFYSDNELRELHTKFSNAFVKLSKTNWDFDKELLNVKYADSWMDTIHRDYPLEIQVLFLEYVSFMAFLSEIIGLKDEAEKYLDLEDTMAVKIRTDYYKNGFLYDSPSVHSVRSNIFLAYYIYPELFSESDWEKIFDNSLKQLKTSWGGISTLSYKDKDYHGKYSGEDNKSYHNGDSWYWINNIAAISMCHLNEKKYRKEINSIVKASTKDILKMGTIGYGSEISSAGEQKAEGCLAQAWSSSTYLEMIDHIFGKKN